MKFLLILLTFAAFSAHAQDSQLTLGERRVVCGGTVGPQQGLSLNIRPEMTAQGEFVYKAHARHNFVVQDDQGTHVTNLRSRQMVVKESNFRIEGELAKVTYSAPGFLLKLQFSTRPGMAGLGAAEARVTFADGKTLRYEQNQLCYVLPLDE